MKHIIQITALVSTLTFTLTMISMIIVFTIKSC
jgi:hypothetical protein